MSTTKLRIFIINGDYTYQFGAVGNAKNEQPLTYILCYSAPERPMC